MTRRGSTHSRGYFGIGIENSKTPMNVGTLWRSAKIFGAAFIFTIGDRYKRQTSDTLSTPRHIPLIAYKNFDNFYEHMPYDCQLIGIELDDRAKPLETFAHPQRCIYLLGAEDHGLTKEARARCHHLVQLPGEHSLNVAVAGSITMYGRYVQLEESIADHG